MRICNVLHVVYYGNQHCPFCFLLIQELVGDSQEYCRHFQLCSGASTHDSSYISPVGNGISQTRSILIGCDCACNMVHS